jgi:hypothetical protein
MEQETFGLLEPSEKMVARAAFTYEKPGLDEKT